MPKDLIKKAKELFRNTYGRFYWDYAGVFDYEVGEAEAIGSDDIEAFLETQMTKAYEAGRKESLDDWGIEDDRKLPEKRWSKEDETSKEKIWFQAGFNACIDQIIKLNQPTP